MAKPIVCATSTGHALVFHPPAATHEIHFFIICWSSDEYGVHYPDGTTRQKVMVRHHEDIFFCFLFIEIKYAILHSGS